MQAAQPLGVVVLCISDRGQGVLQLLIDLGAMPFLRLQPLQNVKVAAEFLVDE